VSLPSETLRPSNHLAAEPSPYLRSASQQPVHWYPWGEEAFAIAKRENKPVLLDIGAVWCHWCHVMDAESYENAEIAEVINERYVAIKVDRDERPDVDTRYQAAVGAISGQGGWPLTAFLTPDGRVFFGGTYFPPEDRYGRMGFPGLLRMLAEVFQKESEKVYHNAEQITRTLHDRLALMPAASEFTAAIVSETVDQILGSYDDEHGGFGTAPKFPNTSAVELLLAVHNQTNDPRLLNVALETLRHIARGGIHDQLAGGFHRYSTDEAWLVPHFEKMLYDNAGLLVNYVHAFQGSSETEFRDVAFDIIRFIDEVLSDRDHGGFFSSQDADVQSGDDGTYFTWSVDETRAILKADEFECIRLYFGITPQGHMHGESRQNVLHRALPMDDVAVKVGKPVWEVGRILETAKRKMLSVRLKRKAPFVDQTVYADLNGMMIHAYFEAFKAFERIDILKFAQKSLDRILIEHSREDGLVSHRARDITGEAFLGDQIEIANACLDAVEVTTNRDYLVRAERIVQGTIENFFDDKGGFFDIPKGYGTTGLLSISNKPIQDSPVASPNSMAILVLNKLWMLTENQKYRTCAAQSLSYFANTARDYGMYASRYFLALNEYLNQPPHVAIISPRHDEAGRDLLRAALSAYRPGKFVTFHRPEQIPLLTGALKDIPRSSLVPAAYVCSNFSCAPPAFTPEALIGLIKTFGRSQTKPEV
jgi:uncharacterized protein